ncbi:hypothetical protein D5047_12895 [Verminephrobacter eiseniae]|nr:hypothetical protein [Verminephrobacter eiseniae]
MSAPGPPVRASRCFHIRYSICRSSPVLLSGRIGTLSMTDRLHRHQQWLRFLKRIDRQTPKIGSTMGSKLTHGRANKWQQSAPSWC